jgi:hypothetical protein
MGVGGDIDDRLRLVIANSVDLSWMVINHNPTLIYVVRIGASDISNINRHPAARNSSICLQSHPNIAIESLGSFVVLLLAFLYFTA